MKKSQISQLVSVLLLLLIGVGIMIFVLPMRDKIATLKESRDTVASELESLQSEYDALSALSEDTAASDASKQELLNAVPSGYSQDDLILELSGLAEAADFDLNAMNFSEAVDQEFGNTVLVSANLSGSYNDLVTFLQKVENADRLMNVQSISVQLTGTDSIVFNLNIEAYYQ